MAGASTTEFFSCTPEELYSIITDYERYPEFLSEIKSMKVIEEDGNRKLVEYKISMIKTFTYRLWMTENPDDYSVTWTFDSGDMFRKSDGSWILSEEDEGTTKATYTVDAKVKMLVPGRVTKMLVNVNLPNMMKSYHKRLEQLREEA